MLRELDRDLWVIDHPFRMPGGVELGTRTTLVRRADGALLLISPGPIDAPLAERIRKLGRVEAILAPNNMHHLFVPDCARVFPEARLFAVAGVARKQKSLLFSVLGGAAPDGWGEVLDATPIEGIPFLDEIAFLHRPTRTLILTDVCFNIRHADSWITRVFMRLNGAYGRFGPSRLLRSQIKDRAAYRRSIDRVLAWDFDRVIVTHGEVLERDGRAALRAAHGWLDA